MSTPQSLSQSSLRVGLFVPCYNVAKEVGSVLDQIPAEMRSKIDEILVIDNGSADNTRGVLQQIQKTWPGPPLTLIFNRGNYMLGGSTQIAFEWGMKKKWDFLISMHGDGQASPKDLPEFFRRLEAKPDLDFILGSRLMAGSRVGDYSLSRRLGNQFFAWMQKLILRNSMKDIGSYIAFNLKTIKSLPFLRIPSDMGYQPNLILYAAQKLGRPLNFEEFPIYWGPVTSSSVNPWAYAAKHFVRLLRYCFGEPPLLPKEFSYEIDVLPPERRP